jgi:lipoprotein-anchoring transpeptidase ErfK/SrfK
MEPNQIAAFNLIEQAQQAMKKGDYSTARPLAAQAAQSAPELEEVWLIMAALASPRGSVAYLQKALEINPQSERAQKGMLWAQNRLKQELEKQAVTARHAAADAPTVAPVEEEPIEDATEPVAVAPKSEIPVVAAIPAVSEPKTAPIQKPAEAPRPVIVTKTTQSSKTVTSRRYSNLLLPLVVVIICFVVAGLVFLSITPAAAFINSNVFNGQEHGPAWAEVNVAKSIASPAALEVVIAPTATPLAASVPAMVLPPTATNALLATDTPLPTNTLIPVQVVPTLTETLFPTETPRPTDLPTAKAEVASVEGPSPTPLPTDTAAPVPTSYIPPTAKPNSGGSNTTAGSSGERWIDVDLTHQMVYAYQGNTVANSFVVSTGTWEHPTVTGQFNVYIKYQSTRMTGPGYNLPNVPYTMYFYKGYALHGTYWHSNFGTPMSHGCVNLSIPDAQWLYNWASVGTLVNVHY